MPEKEVIINKATERIAKSHENKSFRLKIKEQQDTNNRDHSEVMQSISEKFAYIPDKNKLSMI